MSNPYDRLPVVRWGIKFRNTNHMQWFFSTTLLNLFLSTLGGIVYFFPNAIYFAVTATFLATIFYTLVSFIAHRETDGGKNITTTISGDCVWYNGALAFICALTTVILIAG